MTIHACKTENKRARKGEEGEEEGTVEDNRTTFYMKVVSWGMEVPKQRCGNRYVREVR